MSLVGGIAVYFLIWFLVLFTVLPFGVRTSAESGEELVEGGAESAPVKPMLWGKMLVTTAIALIVWSAVFVVMEYRLLTLDDIPFLPRFGEAE